MRKWVILLLLIILAYIGYNYIYQDHRDIQQEQAEFTLSSHTIADEFIRNPSTSEKKYLSKTIEILGTVSEINDNDLTLDNKVFCQFENTIKQSLKLDSKLNIKGRCIGYDDLLEQIKMDQCFVIK